MVILEPPEAQAHPLAGLEPKGACGWHLLKRVGCDVALNSRKPLASAVTSSCGKTEQCETLLRCSPGAAMECWGLVVARNRECAPANRALLRPEEVAGHLTRAPLRDSEL